MSENHTLKKALIAYNAKQSKQYVEFEPERKRSVKAHPTKLVFFECMDGRINASLSAGLPAGITTSFRSMGGIFDLGIPEFARTVGGVVKDALVKNRGVLLICTYHFSKGDHHRGCKGYGYDTEAAIAGTIKFCAQLKDAFAFAKNSVHPIVLGIETDEDRFIVDEKDLKKVFEAMQKDLEFLLSENKKNADVLAERSVSEMNHCEQIIAVGHGFEWLHSYNKTLIIGPWCYDLNPPVITAANIVLTNLKEKRIPSDEGALLLCSAVPADETEMSHLMAEKEAKALAEHFEKMIIANVGDQDSDFAGGVSEKDFKLPDPFYITQ